METPSFAIGAFGAIRAEPVSTAISVGCDPAKVQEWIQIAADFAFWQGALAGRQSAFEEVTRVNVN